MYLTYTVKYDRLLMKGDDFMSSVSNITNMTIRIDKKFKKDMDCLFKNLGINTSAAIMMFLKQCEREQGIPFAATMKTPNKRLLSALEESEDIINGKIKAKRYENFDAMIKDLD